MGYFVIGAAIVGALEGATQREVAKELGYSQAWVNMVARFYLTQIGETRWYLVSSRTSGAVPNRS
jgi:hypothetical protein